MRTPFNKHLCLAFLLALSTLAPTVCAIDQDDNLSDDIRFSRDLARFRFFDLAVEWLSRIEKQGSISDDNKIELSLAKATVAELASKYAVTRQERMKYFDESATHYQSAIGAMPAGMDRRKAEATADGLARVLIAKGTFFNEELARLTAQEADAASIKAAHDDAEAAFRQAVTTLNTVYADITEYIGANEESLEEETRNSLGELGLYALYRKGESYFNWAQLYPPQEFNREDYLNKCIESLTDYIWEAGDGGIFPMLAYYFQGMAYWELGKIQPDKAMEQDAKAIAQLQPIYGEFGINEEKLGEMSTIAEDDRGFVLSILERAYRGESEIYRAAAERFEQSQTIADDQDLTQVAFGYSLIKTKDAVRSWLVAGPVTKATLVPLLRNAAVGVVAEMEDKFKRHRLPLGEEGRRAQLAKARALVDLGRAGDALSLAKEVAQSNEGSLVGMEANSLLSELLGVTDSASQPPDVWMMAADGAFNGDRFLDAIDAYHRAIQASASESDRKQYQSPAWSRIAECYQRLGRNLEAAMAYDAGYRNASSLGDEEQRDELALAAYNAWNRRFGETRTDFDQAERNRIRDEVTKLGISGDVQFLVAREAFVNASAVKDANERKAAFAKAVAEFDGVAESSIYYERALVYKARCHAEAGNPDKAVAVFDEMIARVNDPKKAVSIDKKKTQQRQIAHAEAVYYKSKVQLDNDKFADVLASLDGYESTFDSQKAFYPSVNYYRVKALVGLGRTAEAEQLVGAMQANFAASDMTTAAINQVASGHQKLYAAVADKASDEARTHLRSAADYLNEYNRLIGYTSFQNLQNVGDWYKEIGELTLAEESYQRLLDKFGKNPKYQKPINDSVKRAMAEVLLEQKKFSDALPLWRDVFAANARNRDVVRNLALCLGGWLGESQNARGIFEYAQIPGAGQYKEAMALWQKIKEGIEASDGKGTAEWWECRINFLYCQYMLGQTDPQQKESAKKLVTQWHALDPDLGGDPHKRRLLQLEQALNR